MEIKQKKNFAKKVIWFVLMLSQFCIININFCDGFSVKRISKFEAFLTFRDTSDWSFIKDKFRVNKLGKRHNDVMYNKNGIELQERKNHNILYVHKKKKKKNQNKDELQVQEIINNQVVSKKNEENDTKIQRTFIPPAREKKVTHKSYKGMVLENANESTYTTGARKTGDSYILNNFNIRSSLKEDEEEEEDEDDEEDDEDDENFHNARTGNSIGKGGEAEEFKKKKKKNKAAINDETDETDETHEEDSGDESVEEEEEDDDDDDEDSEELPFSEEDLEIMNKTSAEKMNNVYNYIKRESYRFNLNNVSNTMLEDEKVKINERIYIIKHICHIKKKENLFIITPYDPYYVNFIYNHFTKEYNELKFYVKDKSVYAVIPPLSENLKNEIRIKIKEKIEDAKGTLRNVRKQMMSKLDKVKNKIGKDVYFRQRNYIQSLHDQTRKKIEAIMDDIR
ncbi:ribosome-recycling factor [Plasmodium gonderi]|uniref:Ribosome-recycling factor n=1 Tax=Plasmodium gonderi TaxID=77519 RepID=A0A1Y1JAH2_PLAGO|nr:ribosome-recycling factor [Plasmodium gonderi]GAW79521.1 ribosome-recycling factor [Plasmodium gonderi]